jgi:hypothetical protein
VKVGDLINWVGPSEDLEVLEKVKRDSSVGIIVGFDYEGDPVILFPTSNAWLQSGPQYSHNVEVISESR